MNSLSRSISQLGPGDKVSENRFESRSDIDERLDLSMGCTHLVGCRLGQIARGGQVTNRALLVGFVEEPSYLVFDRVDAGNGSRINV